MIRTDTGYKFQINWVFVAVVLVLALVAAWMIRSILLLTFASVLLVVVFSFPVRFLHNRFNFNRGLSILLTVIGSVVALVILALLVFPTLIGQFGELATTTIPNGLRQLVDWWNSGEIYRQLPYLENVLPHDYLQTVTLDSSTINQIASQTVQTLGQLGGSFVPLLGSAATGVLSVLIVFFLSMYFLAEPDRYIDGTVKLSPMWYRDRSRHIFSRLDTTLRAWVRVTAISMLIVGLGSGLGLALLGIEQWAALGVIAGVLFFIPNFGTLLALIPSLAVGIVQTPENLVWIIVILYGVALVQSQIVGPVLTNENMNLPPVLILVGQIVFGIFFGFIGIMLAVPLTAIAVILVDEIYIKDVLGDNGSQTTPEDYEGLIPDGS